MFKLVYGDGGKFKRIFSGAVKPLDIVPLRASSETLELRALTPDKNMMIEVVIPSTSFEVVEVESETTLALSRESFLKGIRRASKRDSVTMMYERASRYLRMLLTNIKTGVEREVLIEISEAVTSLIEPIQVELPVRFQIAFDDLRKLVRDVKIVGDEIELVFKEGSVEVVGASENKTYRTTLALDRPLYQLESKESMVSSKYDVDYLRTVLVTLSVSDLVTVEFGSGLPLKIHTALEDGTKIAAWIAPRV
jgi:proliferating cell nuclear antigen